HTRVFRRNYIYYADTFTLIRIMAAAQLLEAVGWLDRFPVRFTDYVPGIALYRCPGAACSGGTDGLAGARGDPACFARRALRGCLGRSPAPPPGADRGRHWTRCIAGLNPGRGPAWSVAHRVSLCGGIPGRHTDAVLRYCLRGLPALYCGARAAHRW